MQVFSCTSLLNRIECNSIRCKLLQELACIKMSRKKLAQVSCTSCINFLCVCHTYKDTTVGRDIIGLWRRDWWKRHSNDNNKVNITTGNVFCSEMTEERRFLRDCRLHILARNSALCLNAEAWKQSLSAESTTCTIILPWTSSKIVRHYNMIWYEKNNLRFETDG